MYVMVIQTTLEMLELTLAILLKLFSEALLIR